MPSKPKRRFLGLNVDEVSVVDSPANEVEFLVTKNLEDIEMAGKASDEAERVAVEQPASDEAVSKALEHVSNIVENVAKAFGLPPSAAGAVAAGAPAAPAAPAVAETVVTEESTEKAMTMKDLMKAVGMKDDEDTMKKLKAAGFDPNQKFPTAKPPADSAKTTKAASLGDDEPFTMAGFTDLIAKAKKFTPGRIDSLKSAVSALKALLDEVEEVPQGTMPGVSPGGSTQFGSSGVKVLTEKSAVDLEILKALTGLTDVVKSLKEENKALEGKIEAVSKARPASESLEASGGTETKVAKSSVWSGLL